MMNIFSGAIWGASWFAIGAALISGFDFRPKAVDGTILSHSSGHSRNANKSRSHKSINII
jgi:hypothetical protein